MSRPWLANEQWQECGICGFPWPLSDLTPQKTEVSALSKRCPYCLDNTDNNYRDRLIAQILQQTAKVESKDLRNEPQMWFASSDVEN